MRTIEIINAELARTGANKSQLASAIGLPAQTLYSALREDCASIDKPKRLDFEMMARIADYFGRDMEYFRQDAPQREEVQILDISQLILKAIQDAKKQGKNVLSTPSISTDDFLTWHETHSGRLENFDRISSSVDLFDAPDCNSKIIKPLSTGATSLASICFQVENKGQLTNALEGFSEPLNRQLVNAHLKALTTGSPVISYQSISERLPNGSLFIGRYRRILAPVIDGGKTLIANFSQEVKGQPLGRFTPGTEPRTLKPLSK